MTRQNCVLVGMSRSARKFRFLVFPWIAGRCLSAAYYLVPSSILGLGRTVPVTPGIMTPGPRTGTGDGRGTYLFDLRPEIG